jgi:hypothetical protein
MQAAAPGTDVREMATARERADRDARLTDQLLRHPGTRASKGWGWGMLGLVRSSRLPVALAVHESATAPHACSYRPLDIPVCAPPGRVNFRSASMYMSACALQGADAGLWHCSRPLADPRRLPYMYLSADARLGHCSCLLSDTRQFSGMYLPACAPQGAPFRVSANTRPLRGRVHPNTGAHPKQLAQHATSVHPRPVIQHAPAARARASRGPTRSVHTTPLSGIPRSLLPPTVDADPTGPLRSRLAAHQRS